jgi:CheY-like chemotaxis protein/HPt (histidine-containing phosphotransfer) domain-containing protein
MSAEVTARLFTPFTQADASTSRQFGGTGLGLSISQRLATLMGGEIFVQSTAGKGSEFTLALPLQHAPAEAPAEANERPLALGAQTPSPDTAAARGQLVLLAEDNEISREVIEEQLDLLGHACERAENGRVALQMWNRSPTRYALLLTDCHMPQMDGFALTEAIRAAEPSGRRLPIIAITANTMQGEARRCLQGGMDDYLSKPLRLQELASMLQKWLPVNDRQDHGALAADSPTMISAVPALPIWDAARLSDLVGDNMSINQTLLEKFLVAAGSQVSEIGVAAAARDFKTVAALAHKLKSAARSMGALALGELCQQMEAAGDADEAPAAFALTQQLPAAFAVARRAIEGHLAQFSLFEKEPG